MKNYKSIKQNEKIVGQRKSVVKVKIASKLRKNRLNFRYWLIHSSSEKQESSAHQ